MLGERRNLNTLPARSASQRMTNPSHFQRIRPRGPMPHDLDYGSVYGSLRGPIPMVGGYVDDVYSPRGNHCEFFQIIVYSVCVSLFKTYKIENSLYEVIKHTFY